MAAPERSGGKERSPNYPNIGLPKAIEFARVLWDREKRTSVPPDVAAKAWGYNSLSGPARTMIAALRQYGLVESTGGGVSLTDLAVDVLVQIEGTDASVIAIKTAAEAPDLFRELSKTHADASDEALKAYLITKKRFSVDGAFRAVRSFRETIALANRAVEGYGKADEVPTTTWSGVMPMPSAASATQPIASVGVTPFIIPLDKSVRVEVRFLGGPLTPKHISKLKAYLDLMGEDFEGSTDEVNTQN